MTMPLNDERSPACDICVLLLFMNVHREIVCGTCNSAYCVLLRRLAQSGM